MVSVSLFVCANAVAAVIVVAGTMRTARVALTFYGWPAYRHFSEGLGIRIRDRPRRAPAGDDHNGFSHRRGR